MSRHRCLRFGIDRTSVFVLLSPGIGRGDQAWAVPQLKPGGDVAARIEQVARHGDRGGIVLGVQQVLSANDDAGPASKEDAIGLHRKVPTRFGGSARPSLLRWGVGLSVASLADQQLVAGGCLLAHPRNNKSN